MFENQLTALDFNYLINLKTIYSFVKYVLFMSDRAINCLIVLNIVKVSWNTILRSIK